MTNPSSPITCIFCLAPDAKPSAEHVFPESIGGSLEILDVCSVCNSWLGANVDVHLVEHLLVQDRRRALNLRGKKGALPRVRLVGELVDLPGVKVIIQEERDGSMSSRLEPPVIRGLGPNGEPIVEVLGNSNQLSEMVALVNKVRARAGQAALSADEVLNSYPAHQYEHPEVQGHTDVDLHAYRRALIKIAYELTHRWLGEAYLSDPNAELLRSIIRDPTFSLEDFQNKLSGQILIGCDLISPPPVDLFAGHVAYILRLEDRMAVYVQVFDLFQALLVVSETAACYQLPETTAVFLDACTGVAIEGPLREVLARAKEMPRARG
jgi:hypothetical protein